MSVRYKSTRGGQRDISFEDVVLGGLGTDKGLFVPETIPTFTRKEIEQFRRMSYPEVAYEIISKFVKPDEVPDHDLRDIIVKSFASFRTTEVTPSVKLKEFWVLELFHGPTFAFKDVALQFLGNLFEFFLRRGRRQDHLTILGATSGDTGSAAIHGLRGKENVNCFVLFPHGKVTEIQEKQMTTVLDPNIHCISIRGDFDDAQSLVKQAFADVRFREDVNLGAINSINWARVLAQITYYFYCWFRVTDGLRNHSDKNLKVNFAVPTGNFGDILAGYFAKLMGLPIDKLVICTNANDVLHRFLETGTYRKDQAKQTIAPSMDISISSNFERYLFYLAGESHQQLNAWMTEFESTGSVTLPPHILEKARSEFLSASSSKTEITDAMRDVYEKESYLVCPHTATAVVAARKLKLHPTHTVILATAHPAKFEDAVALALHSLPIPPRPDILQELFDKTLVRKTMIPPSLSDIQSFVRGKLLETSQTESRRRSRQKQIEVYQRAGLWWAAGVLLAAAIGGAFHYLRRQK